jgi:hypothetical protein
MARTGRPSLYTPGIAEKIIGRLSEGEPLAHICRGEQMPSVRTVSAWKETQEGFGSAFGLARDFGFDALAARCLEIADTPIEGEEAVIDSEGKRTVKRGDMLGHRRLQIETILKLLAKWDPRRYGERQQVEHSGGLTLEQLILNSMKPRKMDESWAAERTLGAGKNSQG